MGYYTPEIEDIREGYKCEILWNQDIFPEDSWVEVEIGDNSTQDFDRIDWIGRIANSKIRTRLLSKEQIEAEGWKHHITYDRNETYGGKSPTKMEFELNNVWLVGGGFLTFFPELLSIKITTVDPGYNIDGPNSSVKYDGYCPSINEFRYINNLIKFNR